MHVNDFHQHIEDTRVIVPSKKQIQPEIWPGDVSSKFSFQCFYQG